MKNIENKSCSNTLVDPKTVFEPYPDPKNSSLGPHNNWKMMPKSSKNQKLDLNKSCLTTSVQPKTVFEPYPDPKIVH